MSFHFIEGLMGGGKSYTGAEICYTCLEEGGVVHTNLPLIHEKVVENGWEDRVVYLKGSPDKWVNVSVVDGEEVYSSDILQMGAEGAENVVVVDETAIKFSSEKQQREAEKNHPIFALIALSRHAGLEVHFLAQVRSHVAKRVRDLAQTSTFCSNCEDVPVIGWYLKRFHGDHKRTIFRGGQLYGSCFFRRRKEICEFYRTDGERDKLSLKSGGQRVKKASAWTHQGVWKLAGGAVVAFGLLFWGLWGTYGLFTKPAPNKKEETAAQPAETRKVDRIAADGSKKQLEVPVKPPAPKGGILLEWDAYDEHQLGGVIKRGGTKIVISRGGRRFFAGGSYEGQRISLQFEVADWHYFVCDNRRVVVVRPMRPEEREVLPPLTIPGPTPASVDLAPVSPAQGILATLHNSMP